MSLDGLTYELFRYHDSRVHLLEVDLTKRSIRPVMGGEAFPLLRVYPVIDAIAEGALAAVGGGFNTVWAHDLGYADQPLHSLVVDREIWTTGVAAGGYGLLIGETDIAAQRNRIRVVVWRADGTVFGVERINCGHGVRVQAFTARGGTNQRPGEGRHYAVLGQPGWWEARDHGEAQRRKMTVLAVSDEPIVPTGEEVTLEARWGLHLSVGDEVTWVQHLGGRNVRHVISGWPQIVRNGTNVVPELEMDPEAPDGPDGWFVRENPRLVMGASKNGRTAYVCTVEGRLDTSEGLRLKELATWLVQHDVYSAVNFDGGGSAFLWLKEGGLVADSTYGDGTLQGLRPDHLATAVF